MSKQTDRTNKTGRHSTSSDSIEEMKQNAQETVERTKQEVKATASELSSKAQRKAEETKQQVQEKAVEVAEQAQEQAQSTAAAQKEQAAGRLDSVAASLRRSETEFRDRNEDQFGEYIGQAASQVEGLSTYLQERDVSQVLEDAREFAREQPEIFVVGALAAGFLAGRFFKSTNSRSSENSRRHNGASRRYGSRRAYARNSYGRETNTPYARRRSAPNTNGTFDERSNYSDERGAYSDEAMKRRAIYSGTSRRTPASPVKPVQMEGESAIETATGSETVANSSYGSANNANNRKE